MRRHIYQEILKLGIYTFHFIIEHKHDYRSIIYFDTLISECMSCYHFIHLPSFNDSSTYLTPINIEQCEEENGSCVP